MKRLKALTKKTKEFHIDTDKELELILQKDSRLKKEKMFDYEIKNNEGAIGGIYYEFGDGKLSLYIVEVFLFKDIDIKQGNEINATAYVATKLTKEGIIDEKLSVCKN